MKRGTAALVAALVSGLGCTPDLGAPPSLITANRLLAVKGDPAEAPAGSDVAFTMLVASTEGTVASPGVLWAFCVTPRPLDENNTVALACSAAGVAPITGQGPMVTGTIPMEACSLFGPDTPPSEPGKPPLRPRDPDVTGGFYQPVRATFVAGGPGGGDLVAFGLERISCNLANAPIDVVQAFRKRYRPNRHPALAGVTASVDGGDARPLAPEGVAPADGMFASVAAGKTVVFRAAWTVESAETYPVFDVSQRVLVDHRETLRVSWYATGGAFEHDRTGRGESETETFAENRFTAPAGPAAVHLWAVLRDDRGGIDYAAFSFAVTGR